MSFKWRSLCVGLNVFKQRYGRCIRKWKYVISHKWCLMHDTRNMVNIYLWIPSFLVFRFPFQRQFYHRNSHYCDVIMGTMASQITSLTMVYSTMYSGADQREHQSSASLAFVRGIHRWPVNSPHKWPVPRKIWWRHHAILISIALIKTAIRGLCNDKLSFGPSKYCILLFSMRWSQRLLPMLLQKNAMTSTIFVGSWWLKLQYIRSSLHFGMR